MSAATPNAALVDGAAIIQKASEILANNTKFLNTPLDMTKGDRWPTACTRPSSRAAAQAPSRLRSSTCSPTRGDQLRVPALSTEFRLQLEEVMKEANKYRRPTSANGSFMPPAHPGHQGPPSHTHASHNAAALTQPAYGPSFPRPSSHTSLASHLQHTAHSNFPSAPQSHASHGTAHRSHPAPDALALVDSNAAASEHQQLRKLYYEVQRGQSRLQQEQQECERLRRTVREREDAVHDARAHSRSARRQLEEEVDRRVAAEKHMAEMKRALQMEQDQRKQAEERAKDSRALVRTLEQQLTQRDPSQRDDSASLRWELEEKCGKVGMLEERLRGAQAELDSRSQALAEAQSSLQRSRAEVEDLRGRLAAPPAPDAAVPDDAEVAGLQAEVMRLNAVLQDRRSGSGGTRGGFAAGPSGDRDLEVVQLRCLLDAKERELAGARGELVAAQAAALAAAPHPQRDGAADALRAQVEGVTEQRRMAERRAAEAEGAKVLLDAECAALRADVQRLQSIVEAPERALPGVVAHAGAALARPCTPAHGSRRAAGKGPPGGEADGDTALTVRTAGSAASAHSWRIEATGAAGSPPHGSGAAAAAEVARLREDLVSAHQLHADLELSSGETMQVLQQQVRELEAQLASERRPGTAQADRGSGNSDSGEAAAAGEWRRKHDTLLARNHQLQQQLVAVRDIHGIEMPLLTGDAAVGPAVDAAPTAATVQATLASVQARQDEAELRMREVLQRRETAERQRSQEWQRRVDALNAQVKGLAGELAAAKLPVPGPTGGLNAEEAAGVQAEAERLQDANGRLADELSAVRADLEALHDSQEAAQAAAQAAQEQAGTAMGEVAEAELRIAAAEGREAAARAAGTALRVEVEGLRQQLEDAEQQLAGLWGARDGAGAALGQARAVEECERLRWELEGLRDALAEARSVEAGATPAAEEDPTGLGGQVRTLREEVLRLKMELEGKTEAAEEAEGLRAQVAAARGEVEELQNRLETQAEENRWCWRQVNELTAESEALREQLQAVEAAPVLAEAEKGAAGLRQELERMKGQLLASEGLQAELGGLRRRLAAAEEATDGVEEVRARTAALEAELLEAQADLREAQGALVAAAKAPADLQAVTEEVWGRALRALRQGIAEALPDDLAAREAAQAGRDEELAAAVAAAVARPECGMEDGAAAAALAVAEEKGGALQQEVARLQTHRKRLEAQAFEAENSLFEVEKELQAALDGKAAVEGQRQEAERLMEQLRRELRQAATAAPTVPAGGGAAADARAGEAERRAAAAEDEAASLELTLKEAEQNLSNAYQDIERLRGRRGAPDASAADARRCARAAEVALESERAKVADLQRQIADLEKEVAHLKAGMASAAPPAAGRRSRAPQRMRQYTHAPASPAPQPPVHSAQDSSCIPPAAPEVASEAPTGSAAGDGAAPPAPVDLVPHATALGAGASTPPWQPMQAQAGTAQSRAVHMHTAADAAGPSAAAVVASLADMQGPGAPEAELSLIEASSLHKALTDPYSHLSLLTPPGPLLPDSSESQRSQSGSSQHAAASPLQQSVGAPGDAAATGGVARPIGFGRRSPQGDIPEAVEGLGSAGLSGPDVPQPSATLSPVASGHGDAGPQGARLLSRRTAEDVLDSTSQWGVTGMGSLENVIDFLGTVEEGQVHNSVDLSPIEGRDCAQSATPAAAVHQ